MNEEVACCYRARLVVVDPEHPNRLYWSDRADFRQQAWVQPGGWMEVGDDSPITSLDARPSALRIAKGRELWEWTGVPGYNDCLRRVEYPSQWSRLLVAARRRQLRHALRA